MLRGRFLKGLLKRPAPEKRPFGESRRWGEVRADLRIKLLASGKVERLRQKASWGKPPLVVADDTGLTSGEGVMPAMIGRRSGGGRGDAAHNSCGVQLEYRRITRLGVAYESNEAVGGNGTRRKAQQRL